MTIAGRRHMRFLVTGWRHARGHAHGAQIEQGLDLAQCVVAFGEPGVPWLVTVVHGDCDGVDRIAAAVARKRGWFVEAHPAQGHPTVDFGPWPGAGPRRNRHMVLLGADLVLAYPGPGSSGTWGCLQYAAECGIQALVFPLTATP